MCRCVGGAGSVTLATVHTGGSEPAPLSSDVEASGFLVGPAVFKTDEGAMSSLAGSIPVRLRSASPATDRRRLPLSPRPETGEDVPEPPRGLHGRLRLLVDHGDLDLFQLRGRSISVIRTPSVAGAASKTKTRTAAT